MKHQKICKEVAEEIEKNVKHLIGTKKASKTVSIGADGKPTKKIDLVAEKTAINYLSNKNIQLITEETGVHNFGKPEYTVILDPIDGTYNATNKIPFYSTSIAIADKKIKKIKYGYVKNLENGNTYTSNGHTTKYNNQKITTSDTEKLKNSSISYYGYQKTHRLEKERLNEQVHRVRTLGCISLEMCYVAAGKLDAFIDIRGAGSTDIAAGSIIIKGAGGSFHPISKKFPTKNVKKQIKTIATNGKINQEIQKTINQ
ncbi:inositol monophosphatase family protein [Methanonatronarchaeum sp. AMET-Sl]|uniref:inositol monophosphatase family protein n=1 Tax=Methanonatronarchaeum sp. AMET-Sl TaxID=3037654 RepID=UPI00244E3E45|nr:inositol monophosphatase family protein [Methanonatronarchaeum sp. AMET-Sl]WGI17368.1 inositol monophosphatase family protein [Methanonatronarchaeum sp. AMET-Sl]